MSGRDPDAPEAPDHASQRLIKSARDGYRALFDRSPLPMLVCELGSLQLLAVNELAAKMHGATPQELVGRSLFELRRVSDLTSAMLRRAGGREVTLGFGYHVKSDGSLLPVQMSVHPAELDGRPAWLCVLKSLEEALSPEDGESKRRMFESLGRLSTGAAHDLNNLLSVILSYTSLLTHQLGADAPAREDLEEIQGAAERAAALTKQLLSLSRTTPGALKPVALNSLVQRMEHLLRRLLDERITMTTSLDPNLELVMADAGQIERLLVNLVASARDASAPGSTLVIATENVALESGVRPENTTASNETPSNGTNYVMLSVSDTAESSTRVFEPLLAGTGERALVGASTVSSIVSQAGGSVWLESDPGAGARFVVSFPSVGKRGDGGSEPSARTASRRKALGEVVLVVEDNPHLRKTLKTYFSRDGYRVLDAESTMEAMRVAENCPRLDLLLTDFVLPDGNGIELGEALRERFPKLKVMIASGHPEQRAAVNEDERTAFIGKPFDLRLFGELVGRLLDQA